MLSFFRFSHNYLRKQGKDQKEATGFFLDIQFIRWVDADFALQADLQHQLQ